jgi:small subunit ribosomal protein S6
VRRYETIFILRPDLGDSAQKDTVKRFEGIAANSGGDLIDTEEWGFRELAYPIKGEHRGFYVRLDYGGNGATMNEIERNLRLSDGVLRYLSVLVDTDVDPAAVRAEIEAHRKRTAEARAAAEAARAAAEAARAAAAAERAEAEQARANQAPPSATQAQPESAGEKTPETDGQAPEAGGLPEPNGDDQH